MVSPQTKMLTVSRHLLCLVTLCLLQTNCPPGETQPARKRDNKEIPLSALVGRIVPSHLSQVGRYHRDTIGDTFFLLIHTFFLNRGDYFILTPGSSRKSLPAYLFLSNSSECVCDCCWRGRPKLLVMLVNDQYWCFYCYMLLVMFPASHHHTNVSSSSSANSEKLIKSLSLSQPSCNYTLLTNRKYFHHKSKTSTPAVRGHESPSLEERSA